MKRFLLAAFLVISTFSYAQVTYYKGEWTKIKSAANFSCILKLDLKDSIVHADILWTYNAIDSSDKEYMEYYKNKKGRMGLEFATGKFSSLTNDFILEGTTKIDPDLIIGLDKYLLKLSLNKQVIYGATYSNGDKNGLTYFIRSTDPRLISEFEAMKERLIHRSQDKALK